MGRWIILVQLHGERLANWDSQPASRTQDRTPTIFRIRTEGLSFHEGNFTVSEFLEVLQGDFGGVILVQNDIGNPVHVLTSCDRDGRNQRGLAQTGVDR